MKQAFTILLVVAVFAACGDEAPPADASGNEQSTASAEEMEQSAEQFVREKIQILAEADTAALNRYYTDDAEIIYFGGVAMSKRDYFQVVARDTSEGHTLTVEEIETQALGGDAVLVTGTVSGRNKSVVYPPAHFTDVLTREGQTWKLIRSHLSAIESSTAATQQ